MSNSCHSDVAATVPNRVIQVLGTAGVSGLRTTRAGTVAASVSDCAESADPSMRRLGPGRVEEIYTEDNSVSIVLKL